MKITRQLGIAFVALIALALELLADPVNPTAYGTLVDLTDDTASRVYTDKAWENGKPATKLFDNGGTSSSSLAGFNGAEVSVVYTFDAATTVNAYGLWLGTVLDRGPKDWTFSGSNDFDGKDMSKATWVTLDTRTGETEWAKYTRNLYRCDNETAYRSYRLSFTATGSGGRIQLSEVEFYYSPLTRVMLEANPRPVGDDAATAYRETAAEAGQELTLSTISGQWENAAADTRATCTGYTLYKWNSSSSQWDEWLSGNASSVTITVPSENTKIIWNYDISYKIDIASGGNGTATGGGWYALGATCTSTVTPAESYRFTGWYGKLNYVDFFDTSFTVDGPASLTAGFSPAGTRRLYVSTTGSDEN